MEFTTCPNCLAVYGDVQGVCPTCGADEDGEGAELTFDGATRHAIQRLGGLFGGILEAGPGAHVLWCSRGVCLVQDDIGLAWRARAFGNVDDVRIEEDGVVLRIGGEETSLDLQDGSEREA